MRGRCVQILAPSPAPSTNHVSRGVLTRRTSSGATGYMMLSAFDENKTATRCTSQGLWWTALQAAFHGVSCWRDEVREYSARRARASHACMICHESAHKAHDTDARSQVLCSHVALEALSALRHLRRPSLASWMHERLKRPPGWPSHRYWRWDPASRGGFFAFLGTS